MYLIDVEIRTNDLYHILAYITVYVSILVSEFTLCVIIIGYAKYRTYRSFLKAENKIHS